MLYSLTRINFIPENQSLNNLVYYLYSKYKNTVILPITRCCYP